VAIDVVAAIALDEWALHLLAKAPPPLASSESVDTLTLVADVRNHAFWRVLRQTLKVMARSAFWGGGGGINVIAAPTAPCFLVVI
jgi:hypothetical protein